MQNHSEHSAEYPNSQQVLKEAECLCNTHWQLFAAGTLFKEPVIPSD